MRAQKAHTDVTRMSQKCYMSQDRYKDVTCLVSYEHRRHTQMLQGCHTSVTRVLQGCYIPRFIRAQKAHTEALPLFCIHVLWVRRVLQGWYKGVTRLLQICYEDAYKGVPRMLQVSYKVLPGLLQNCLALIEIWNAEGSKVTLEQTARVLQGCYKGVTRV
jgi:hypothetical protein